LAFLDSVLVDLQAVRAVFEVVRNSETLGGQFFGLADRDESRAQGISQGRREDKAARLDAENYVDLRLAVVILEAIDDGAEAAGVLEERGDVVEQDPRFREVRDL